MRALVCLVLASCATTPLHVRDIEGRPLPTSARLDADLPPANVQCDGRSYTIVEAPPPFLAGTSMATRQVVITDAALLCTKIRAND